MTAALIITAFAVLMIAPAVLTVRSRCRRAHEARRAAGRWPSVPGRIITSGLQNRAHAGDSGATSSAYGAVVWYEYVVEGRRYSSNVIDIGDAVMREANAHWTLLTRVSPSEAVRRYAAGDPVDVFYDPQDPRRACLQR